MFSHVQLGISPINWTNDDDPSLGGEISFEQCIREMHEAGYEGCEMGNRFPKEIATLQKALSPYPLQIVSAWFDTYFTIKEKKEATLSRFKKHCDFLKAMGALVIVVCECAYAIQGTALPILSNQKYCFSKKEWQRLIDGLHEIGEYARYNDMHIVYHAHMGTGIQTDVELEYLMHHSDPELVSLLVDTGHSYFAGGDPLSIIKMHSKRIRHVHLKDVRESVLHKVKKENLHFMDAVRSGVFTVPGDGDINFESVFFALSEAQYKGWMIVEAEQDPKKANPYVYAKNARETIRALTGL